MQTDAHTPDIDLTYVCEKLSWVTEEPHVSAKGNVISTLGFVPSRHK